MDSITFLRQALLRDRGGRSPARCGLPDHFDLAASQKRASSADLLM
jgi:hypothetical protein